MRISDWSSDVCSSDLDGGVDRGVTGDVEIADELVEEQPAQALGAAGVPGELRPLHHLWEVHEREHRAVEVREVAPQDISLVGCEVLGDVDGHRSEEHTSELQSLMRISYAVFCLKKTKTQYQENL